MQIKEFFKKITTPPRKTVKYQSLPTRNFYNSILTADVFEKQKFFFNSNIR